MHKKLPGVRIIAGGCGLSLTAVSQVVSRACKLILRAYDKIYHEMFIKVGFNRKSPIAISTDDINIRTDYFNTLIARKRYNITNGKVLSMDFTKLYPSLEVDPVLEKLQVMIAFAFHREETDFLSKPNNDNKALKKQKIYIKIEQYPSKAEAEWAIGPPPQDNIEENDNDPDNKYLWLDVDTLYKHVRFVFTNAYTTFAGGLYHQLKGVPTGTNSSPEIANLFLLYYELQFFQNKMKNWSTLEPELQSFLLTYSRFIDDIFAVTTDKEMTVFHNDDMQRGITFGDGEDGIFPMFLLNKTGGIIDKPLQIEGEEGRAVNFLDETISIRNGRLRRTLYRKADFIVVAGAPLSDRPNFPKHDSKLTIRSKYGVFDICRPSGSGIVPISIGFSY